MTVAQPPETHGSMPETDVATLGEFEITSAAGVRKLLGELAKKRALIWLFLPDKSHTALSSRLIAIDDDQLEFSLQADTASREALHTSRSCTVVGFLDSVKVQFEMGLTTNDPTASDSILAGAMPTRVYRIQRRAAFRVRPPEDQPASVVIRGAPGQEHAFTIFDMSATGLSFVNAKQELTFSIGQQFSLARLELGPRVPIPCTFVIRSVRQIDEDDRGEWIGCEFVNLPSEVERAVAVYVQDAERTMLRKRHQ